jgi:anaerobic selenocysteine-containing dehydrogenase
MSTETVTYCRICESLCGMIATVDNGAVTRLRPDTRHPISQGFACPKGVEMADVQNDPRRPVYPLRRRADGSFERVSWRVALGDIGSRLRAVRDRYGSDAIGMYMGNPMAFTYSGLVWTKGTADALGSPHFYTASSQDTNSRLVASALFYGSPLTVGVPDLHRTDLLLMLGANPIVSHGSMIAGTQLREALTGTTARGGRVVVVDPRRTETARLFEHVGIRPDGDAWLMLSMLQVIFTEDLADRAALERLSVGADQLRALAERFRPEETEQMSGVDAGTVRMLARDLATSRRAAVYGRVGVCTGGFGTLVCFLVDALNAVTGNLDRPGGSVFPTPPVDIYRPVIKRGLDTYGARHSRVGGLPDVLGTMPAGVMADEILTPGPGQLRALLVVSGNPVLSVPDGPALKRALGQLDLVVSIDIGFNDTNRDADYILPATTFLEREDMPLQMFAYQLRTFVQWVEPVIEPRGEARQEWEIMRDICAELELVPNSLKSMQRLGAIGRAFTPRAMFTAMLRLGPYGDRFGLRRGGINARVLRANPHGVVLADEVCTGVLPDRITHSDRRIHLAPPQIVGEVDRLWTVSQFDEDYPLRLFGRRELRSINSWMKNARKLTAGGSGPTLQMHPLDAAELSVVDGERVRVSSAGGVVVAIAEITDDITRGAVCLPHGWGHEVGIDGRSTGIGGPNSNSLTRAGAQQLEPLAGMSVLNGIRVRVEPLDCPEPVAAATAWARQGAAADAAGR